MLDLIWVPLNLAVHSLKGLLQLSIPNWPHGKFSLLNCKCKHVDNCEGVGDLLVHSYVSLFKYFLSASFPEQGLPATQSVSYWERDRPVF
jgi:hypothetical protein